jgi:hypothetical protein
MPDIMQIRFSGFGGQGIVLAGMLLSIAGVEEGLEVKHFEIRPGAAVPNAYGMLYTVGVISNALL